MTAAANTIECFGEFVGQRLIGVLRDALPSGRVDLSKGTKSLIFEDGRALTIAANGSYWIESKVEVERAVLLVKARLEATERELREVLALAGKEQEAGE